MYVLTHPHSSPTPPHRPCFAALKERIPFEWIPEVYGGGLKGACISGVQADHTALMCAPLGLNTETAPLPFDLKAVVRCLPPWFLPHQHTFVSCRYAKVDEWLMSLQRLKVNIPRGLHEEGHGSGHGHGRFDHCLTARSAMGLRSPIDSQDHAPPSYSDLALPATPTAELFDSPPGTPRDGASLPPRDLNGRLLPDKSRRNSAGSHGVLAGLQARAEFNTLSNRSSRVRPSILGPGGSPGGSPASAPKLSRTASWAGALDSREALKSCAEEGAGPGPRSSAQRAEASGDSAGEPASGLESAY